MLITTFHTQECRHHKLDEPILGKGNDMWLGDAYYFWQDFEFALEWGRLKKCKFSKKDAKFEVYKADLKIDPDFFLDTVFNEKEYYFFLEQVEKFADKYIKKWHNKPSLEDFNAFIADLNIWPTIKVIRFQDIPENNNLVLVTGFYYKKRIQFAVFDPDIIVNFELSNTFDCIRV